MKGLVMTMWNDEEYMREDDRYERPPIEGVSKDGFIATIKRFYRQFMTYQEPKD